MMSSLDRELSALFESDKRNSTTIDVVQGENPAAATKIYDFLASDNFTRVTGGQTWEQIQHQNSGRLSLLVSNHSVFPIGTGEGLPVLRYLMRNSVDEFGMRDFLGTRANLVVLIDHALPGEFVK